jgi:hypothetical protein
MTSGITLSLLVEVVSSPEQAAMIPTVKAITK